MVLGLLCDQVGLEVVRGLSEGGAATALAPTRDDIASPLRRLASLVWIQGGKTSFSAFH